MQLIPDVSTKETYTYRVKDFEAGSKWRFPKKGFVGGPGGKFFGRELLVA